MQIFDILKFCKNKTKREFIDESSEFLNDAERSDSETVSSTDPTGNSFRYISTFIIPTGGFFNFVCSDYGKEISSPEKPTNGRLQIMGAASGQFCKSDYSPEMRLGDFYVFPYDIRHCVYPWNGNKETRRTLVCNVDVEYNPVSSRSPIEIKK